MPCFFGVSSVCLDVWIRGLGGSVFGCLDTWLRRERGKLTPNLASLVSALCHSKVSTYLFDYVDFRCICSSLCTRRALTDISKRPKLTSLHHISHTHRWTK
jgi:hypothetical protein